MEENQEIIAQWYPHILGLGLSAFVGIAIGIALRKILKWTLVVVGVFLLLLFAGQQMEFLTINMDHVEDQFTANTPVVVEGLRNYLDKIAGLLPASAIGFFGGLMIGWRFK